MLGGEVVLAGYLWIWIEIPPGRWQKRSHGTCGIGDLTKTEELENIYINECLEKLGGRWTYC